MTETTRQPPDTTGQIRTNPNLAGEIFGVVTGWQVTIIAVGAFILAALPLALSENLLLIDYPEHLATFHTLQNYSKSPHLQDYYAIREGLYPYWGVRAMMSVLTPLFGVEGGLKAFAIFAILMPAAGACALGWTLAGRLTLLPLVSLLFVYNDILHWGFINFLFSTGIAMFCFAAWIGSSERPAGVRFPLLAVAAVCLIWMHPLASCILGLMVGLWEISRCVQYSGQPGQLKRLWHIVLAGLCFVPAMASLILLTSFDGSGGGYLHMGHLSDRAWIALTPFWLNASYLNLAAGLAGLAVVGALVLTGLLKVAPGVPRFIVYFVIAAYAAPFVVFGVFYVNLRLPVFACLAFAAGLQLSARGSQYRAMVYRLLGLVFAAKLVTSAVVLSTGSGKVTELRNAFAAIPAGAKVLQVIDRSSPSYPGMIAEADYQNLGSYLIVDRDAFIPDIFGSVEIAYSKQVSELAAPMSVPPDFSLLVKPVSEWRPEHMIFAKHAGGWQGKYDYLLLIDFGAERDNPKGTETVARGSYFKILKVSG